VIVSLDFPAIQRVTGYQFDRAFRNLSDEEARELDERDRMAVESNPGVVADLGVPFALSTSGMMVSRFHRNLRTAIEAGLDPDRALRALTIEPATLFGVDRILGSLEAGKIANLTVTRGDFFADEDAEVACVFIDGVLEAFTDLQMREGGDHDRR
jgi:imidazolonepropionase-like amidohydrolase